MWLRLIPGAKSFPNILMGRGAAWGRRLNTFGVLSIDFITLDPPPPPPARARRRRRRTHTHTHTHTQDSESSPLNVIPPPTHPETHGLLPDGDRAVARASDAHAKRNHTNSDVPADTVRRNLAWTVSLAPHYLNM